MTTTTMPKRISEAWLKSAKTRLDATVASIDGEPNPNYTSLAKEIAEADSEKARRDAFEAWVLKAYGMRVNVYPLRLAGVSYEPLSVFMHKDKATGKVASMAIDAAWDLYLIASEDA